MTKLTKPVERETDKHYGALPVVVTLAPAHGGGEALIGLRLKGRRTQYICTLSDVYRVAADWHGAKERIARAAARRAGVPWRKARLKFLASCRI